MRPSGSQPESTPVGAARRESRPALVHARAVRWTAIPAVAIAVVGVAVALGIDALPLIPSWKAVKVAAFSVIGVAVVVAIGWHVVATWHAGRRGLSLAVGVAAALLAVAVIWLVLANAAWPNPLRGEELVASVRDDGSGDEIFVYHLTEIPDGFIAARVAVRRGWLPFERTILEVQEPFTASESSDSSLELMFGIGGDIRYAYSNGRFDPSGVKAGPS